MRTLIAEYLERGNAWDVTDQPLSDEMLDLLADLHWDEANDVGDRNKRTSTTVTQKDFTDADAHPPREPQAARPA